MVKIEDIRTHLLYDPKELSWIELEGNVARIGMSPLTQETTGSFVSVHFEEPGTRLAKGRSFGSVEAEKHVGHLKAPLSGTVLRINERVLENPRLINTDPYGEGWLMEMQVDDPGEFADLVQGAEAVHRLFESEITKLQEKGWLAE